ncbi:methionyl-tRNA formyltransferase [Vagococcus luciliae]|uniref:Methionyl-tRNA formyltransferase n=1 Tax=Vagococcus luciliae TaxID=2920380 RepID=A0ABY5NX76_9ENTE|nr:methionyl-tRNA formyltransferase [Vagococcus luciliae]UUV98250.1 Methionyl-tRNA formyltransferase [Vagococcus luciliae]
MTKIVFMGTPAFSVPILQGLVDEGYDVIGVVTQPDRPVGRKRVLTPPPVKQAALDLNLPIFQPEKISQSAELEDVIALNPDLVVTAAFGQFLPERLLKAPKLGAVNVHASLLPKYRGGAPVHYSIINGDKETGVTIMEMIKKMDAGDILAQEAIPILDTDDVGTMFEKLSVLGKELLLKTLPLLIEEKIIPQKQDENLVSFSPNISREEEKIDWNKTARQIDCQVRGMRPWPVAYAMYQDKRWKMWDVTPLPEKTTDKSPGTIILKDKHSLQVACGKSSVLQLNTIQPAGKGQLSVTDFLNGVGKTVEVGDILE